MISPTERVLVGWSFTYFFCLLAGYFILRPIRDEMGILNGASNMQWLFTGTFSAMLLLVPLFGYVTKRFSIKGVLIGSHLFFLLNILLYYILIKTKVALGLLAVIYFIWLSVFNLFVVSLFWSFMADVFSSDQAKRLFGLIAAGGSLGALAGPMIASFIVSKFSIENLFLVAFLFLLLAFISMRRIISLKNKDESSWNTDAFIKKVSSNETTFKSISKVFTSPYLRKIVLFVFLYTSVSTFLYFEQAHILEESIKESSLRVVYFSQIDLATNCLSIFGQFLLTHRIIKMIGMALTLAVIPLLIGFGFFALNATLTIPVIAVTLIIHRAGNFTLLRPGREILFTITKKNEKYRAKNFIDTTIYRGGDALTGWMFSGFLSLGFGLSSIALIGIPFALTWSLTGYSLGRQYSKKEKKSIKGTNYETEGLF